MIPGFVLNWAREDQTGVLTVKVYLNQDAEIIGYDLEPVPGMEPGAATAAYRFGELAVQQGKTNITLRSN